MTVFDNLYHAAEAWLARGATLVPLQPNSKEHVAGFGPHRRRISTLAEAQEWFGTRRCNLGVVVPENMICLDFDEPSLYGVWRSGEGTGYRGIIERSRVGYHVWGFGQASGHQPIAGVEFKKPGQVVTVAPSRVEGVGYVLLTLDTCGPLAFTSLTAGIFPTKQITRINPTGHNLIARLKSEQDVLKVAEGLTTLRVTSGGRYWVGACPFHPDPKSHFWVDTQKGLCGCHYGGCKFHGPHDVLNLLAERDGVSLKETIRTLAGEVGR